MAKVQVNGQSVVITSSIRLEDLKTVLKYRPEALVLYGGEDNKEEIFRVGITERSAGIISAYGVEFGGTTHDDEKFATVTLGFDSSASGDALKEEISDLIGTSLINLNKIERKFDDVLKEITKEKERIYESITIN